MAVEAIRPVKDVAFVHCLARCIYADCWFRWGAVTKRRSFQFCVPADGKHDNPTEARLCDSPVWPIEEARVPSPARHHGYVLHSINFISDWRSQDARSRIELPQFFTVSGTIGKENPVGAALKHEIPRGSEHTPRLHTRKGHVPNL